MAQKRIGYLHPHGTDWQALRQRLTVYETDSGKVIVGDEIYRDLEDLKSHTQWKFSRVAGNPVLSVRGRDWIQESYETGDPKIRQRTAALKKMGYRAKAFGMGSQVTQYGLVKMTMVDIRPGSSGDAYLENVPVANPRARNAGPYSIRKTKKRRQFRASGKPYEYAYTGNLRPGQQLGKKRLAHAKRQAAAGNPIIPRGKALAFSTKAQAERFTKTHKVKGYRFNIRKAAG